jgi:hypothetical protein
VALLSGALSAGQHIDLPANREHAYRVASDRAHYYLLLTPSGLETFFQATGTAASEGDEEGPLPTSPQRCCAEPDPRSLRWP